MKVLRAAIDRLGTFSYKPRLLYTSPRLFYFAAFDAGDSFPPCCFICSLFRLLKKAIPLIYSPVTKVILDPSLSKFQRYCSKMPQPHLTQLQKAKYWEDNRPALISSLSTFLILNNLCVASRLWVQWRVSRRLFTDDISILAAGVSVISRHPYMLASC